MRSSTFSLLVAAAGTNVAAQTIETGQLGNATVVTNNPPGKVYKATLPDTAWFKPAYPDGGNIEGSVTAVANPDGKGVEFTLKFSNLPKTGGPFMYHLHVDPVPANGNCTATLAHHDPFIRGEATLCNPEYPETCQVGDLSGKYGDIPEGQDAWETSYVDLYASTVEGLGSFFGNRSIVFHYANKTRITCASFELVADGDKGHGGHGDGGECASTGVPKPTGNSTTTVRPPTPTGSGDPQTSLPTAAASGLKAVGGAGALAFAAAIMFML